VVEPGGAEPAWVRGGAGGAAPLVLRTSAALTIVEHTSEQPSGDVQQNPVHQNPVQQNPEKDPGDWATGDEPMTGPQRSYLQTLAQEAGEQVPDGLTKAQASEQIDKLQEETGRGQ